jgi:hypothetical protein
VNKTLSFLKTAEQDLAKVIAGAARLMPFAETAAETVAVASGHADVVSTIEKIGSIVTGAGAIVTTVSGAAGTGAQKLAIAVPQVDQLIKSSGFLGAQAIADEQKWSGAIQTLTGAIADLYDSLAPAPAAAATPTLSVAALNQK